ncbi:TSC complex subunit 1a isoform X2 [Gouania willdenowi]|uniref:TSC complex subunit 1a isoform X2 n=1 Tax=Gouania willdenowi TaxID=441366 RepID=UPI00105641E2|nr:hamartin-like isoform X2 [Gouania willdenowi]
MSKEQLSISELLLSLDSSELQEAEHVRAAVNQQLSSDRGGAVLSALVDFYLESWSNQAALLLSSIRESNHKVLLEKLTEAVNRPAQRLAAVSLLGELVRKQPPWIHLLSRSPLLPALLRCLKTDTDVVVLITGVLVLVTLLPMIPQTGKQHLYDFFDVFGRLASWSYKNPGNVPEVHLLHLHASVYSLFHRLYGMFPVNFISYLRLHYSMKENLDTFQEVVKPMLEHVRVHPELVTGTQDYELDPSRWKRYEVHDILIECSRLCLDVLESSCEDDVCSPPASPHLNLTCSPALTHTASSSVSAQQLTLRPAHIQADDVTWSPSMHCGLATPPPESVALGSVHSLTRTTSISGVRPPTEDGSTQQPIRAEQEQLSSFQPIPKQETRALSDISSSSAGAINEAPPPLLSEPHPLTSTPGHDRQLSGPVPFFTSPQHIRWGTGSAPSGCSPASPYDLLLELALPHATPLFLRRKTKERSEAEQEEAWLREDATVSPLKVLDQLIIHGDHAHQHFSRRLSAGLKSVERSPAGGPAHQESEFQCLRSQLMMVHAQLQYERFKRQQHAVRNRRLLRRVINAAALEEHSAAMKAQLLAQDEEIRCLNLSLQHENTRYVNMQHDNNTQRDTLQTHNRQLLQQHQEAQTHNQKLQSELQECRSQLKDQEAELQRANKKAYNSEHQLSQLSMKLSSTQQLQQQMFLMNQQLILLRETNRALSEQLDGGRALRCTEASMLQCSVDVEYQQLKESDMQLRQKLEAANHRIAELEDQLITKDQLIQDQKKLLEETKNQSRCELKASDSRCSSLRKVCQALQTEMLQLYSEIQQFTHTRSQPQDVNRPNGGGGVPQRLRPSSSALGVINGGAEEPNASPPIESPLAVGSFLEQHARQLFGPTNQSPVETEKQEEEEEEDDPPDSPPLGQEVEENMLLIGSPQADPPLSNQSQAGTARQRQNELSIMDYD